MTDLQSVTGRLCNILNRKAEDVGLLIKEAVEAGIHVDILVCGKPQADFVKQYFVSIGVSEHENLLGIHPDLPEWRRPDHFQLKIGNICAE